MSYKITRRGPAFLLVCAAAWAGAGWFWRGTLTDAQVIRTVGFAQAQVRTQTGAQSPAPSDVPAHAGHAAVGWIPQEILNRPVSLRSGIGAYHESVTTPSAIAQKF